MNVKELIEVLQKQNPDDKVYMEGCDCYQEPSGKISEVGTGEILIENTEN